jgi:hypothetical protein
VVVSASPRDTSSRSARLSHVRFQLIFAWKTSLVSRARTDRALVLVVFQVHRRNLTLQVALLAKWSRVRAAAPGASKGVDVQVEDVLSGS